MILIRLEPAKNDDDRLQMKRIIVLDGNEADIVSDLRAVGYGLLNSVKQVADREKRETILQKYQNAFQEGLRMSQEEMKAADQEYCDKKVEELFKKFMEEIPPKEQLS